MSTLIRRYTFGCLLLFVVMFVFGYCLPYSGVGYTPSIDALRALRLIRGHIFLTVLLTNVKSFFLEIVGVFTLGIWTAILLTGLGLKLGVMARRTDWQTMVLMVLPHGLFETLAFAINGGAAFSMIHVYLTADTNKNILNRSVLFTYASAVAYAITLLIIAAAVEAFITPEIALREMKW